MIKQAQTACVGEQRPIGTATQPPAAQGLSHPPHRLPVTHPGAITKSDIRAMRLCSLSNASIYNHKISLQFGDDNSKNVVLLLMFLVQRHCREPMCLLHGCQTAMGKAMHIEQRVPVVQLRAPCCLRVLSLCAQEAGR